MLLLIRFEMGAARFCGARGVYLCIFYTNCNCFTKPVKCRTRKTAGVRGSMLKSSSMDENERNAWVIQRLGNDAKRDDVILELCQSEGWTWPQAEAYIEQVAQEEAPHINRRKGPALLALSLGALTLGLAQSGFAYFMLFYPLLKRIHEPLTLLILLQSALSVPLFVPQVIAGMGLGVAGLIGVIRTLESMRHE